MTKIIVSVISDLVTDQRVHKVSQTLHDMGFDVLLVGTKRSNSLPLQQKPYKTKRIAVFFKTGFLFFAEWNIRLFFLLLFKKASILLPNDLDTLAPSYLVGKIKSNVVVYDTHEFYTETAELYNRPFVKKFWTAIERFFFPGVKYIYTVNDSIAALYKKKYNKDLLVVRNVPLLYNPAINSTTDFSIGSFGIPADKKIILLQGNGINENRGAEEFVLTANLLSNDFILVIAGTGLIIDLLKSITAENNLGHKIIFTGVIPFEQLQQLTQTAFCGCSLDKPININQQASLPNKIFDYMAADIPVVVSNIKEVANIVKQYQVGIVIDEVTPANIAAAINQLAGDEVIYNRFKQNTLHAISILNWDKEKKVIENLFETIAKENSLQIV